MKTREKAVDGNGSELCPILLFHISSSKSSGFTNRVWVIIRQSFSECKYLKTWHTKDEELNVAYTPLVWMSNGGHFLCCGSHVKSINVVIGVQDGQTHFNSHRVGVPSMGYKVHTAVLKNILLLTIK